MSEPEELLSPLERWQLRVIRESFERPGLSKVIQWCQAHIGQRWISLVTKNLHHVHHLDRVPRFTANESFIVVANHRSFFDLYVVISTLVREGFPQRILFPVRSNFFYDHPLGFVVNGAMSFFAMYPPIFRDKKKAGLNISGLEDAAALLRAGGHLVGFHPEGTRNREDPYNLLPMRSGVGRLIHSARVPVIPVFTNGLRVDNLPLQIKGNFDGTGTDIHTVFGAPIEFGALLDQPGNQSTFKQIANRVGKDLKALAAEERSLRAQAGGAPGETKAGRA
jgi:1-acyl-sn-glycerol-3-phosphate acyltransferase